MVQKNNITGNEIFLNYKKRIPNLEESYPTEIDGYKYFSSISVTSEHRKYFRIYRNKKKLLLDVNKLAKDKNYYSISGIQPSRNHKFIAYGEDLNGDVNTPLLSKILIKINNREKSMLFSGGVVWSTDSKGYFYLKKDPKTLITNSLFITS